MEEKQYKTFVFVADEDVFHTFRIEDAQYAEPLIAGMRSNPIVVEVTGQEHYSTELGWKYSNGSFYRADQPVPVIIDEDDYEVD
jgi:hypothetical protein